MFSSFNPSSIGNRPQSCAGCCGCNAVHEFQSFFYWKSASKTKREFEAVELYKFQSFFYWKSASKRSFSTRLPSLVMSFNPSSIGNRPQRQHMPEAFADTTSFNPSSIGNRPQSIDGVDFAEIMLSFQSFFYWKSASKFFPSPRCCITFSGFNPSSIGNRPQRIPRIFPNETAGVSILLLLEIGLKVVKDAKYYESVYKFQSFFYWKSASK